MAGQIKGKSYELETETDTNKSVAKAQADDFSIDGSIDELKYKGGSFITNSSLYLLSRFEQLQARTKQQMVGEVVCQATWIYLLLKILFCASL